MRFTNCNLVNSKNKFGLGETWLLGDRWIARSKPKSAKHQAQNLDPGF
jgi:hypothetical protein